jgi:hypothetical protein
MNNSITDSYFTEGMYENSFDDAVEEHKTTIFKKGENLQKLNILSYQKHNHYIEKTELINPDKLNYIIQNRATYEPLLKKDERRVRNCQKQGIDPDPFNLSAKMLKNSRKGKLKVLNIQKNGVGRHNARSGISLLNLTRQIRQTVADECYQDIDIVNAHPNLLRFLCDELNIECEILASYCDDRKGFFERNKITKDVGKVAFLKVMNGGSNNLPRCTELKNFYKYEIKDIHNRLSEIYSEEFNNHKEKLLNRTNPKLHNHKGSFMNIILCDLENTVLMKMLKYFGDDENAVLCFDGIMIRNDRDYDLKGCEEFIKNNTGININLTVKPFKDGFDLTGKFISTYIEDSYDFYNDYRKFVCKDIEIDIIEEWFRNTCAFVESGGSSLFFTKNSDYDQFLGIKVPKYTPVKPERMLKTLGVNVNVINPKFDYLYWKKHKNSGVRSEERKDIRFQKYIYESLGTPPKKVRSVLIDFMFNRRMNVYDDVDFAPYLSRDPVPDRIRGKLNLFTGFVLESMPKSGFKFENSLMYAHIRDVLMNKDEGAFNHFLDHIADIIQDGHNIKDNAHLFFSKQGAGKGLLYKFIERLIGETYCLAVSDEKDFFNNFNTEQANKLLTVFEEVQTRGGAYEKKDKLKAKITSDKLRLEPKGCDSYNIANCSRYWFFTNNENSLFIENDDRRFTCHRVNNERANDRTYFKPLWDEIANKEWLKCAFDFFAERKYTEASVRSVYATAFKTSQKELNLPLGLKFLKDFAEDEEKFEGATFDGNIGCKVLSNYYREWCSDFGCQYKLHSFKTQIRSLGLIDRRITKGGRRIKGYELNSEILRDLFRKYLKNDEFDFDN